MSKNTSQMSVGTESAKAVAIERQSDIALYAGSMEYLNGFNFEQQVRARKSADNIVVLLATLGGSAETAYRLARCFQEVYKGGEFVLFVDTLCKSAGTIFAVGARSIVMSDRAEFGPIDVQLRKPEELGERTSGLTLMQALSTLRAEVGNTFENLFVDIRKDTGVSTRIAAEAATEITTGLFGPIYSLIEPVRLGENERAMLVATEYGKRLIAHSKNTSSKALLALVGEYPSHEFVIDRSEAKKIFSKIESPSDVERQFAEEVIEKCFYHMLGDDVPPWMEFWPLASLDNNGNDSNDEENDENDLSENSGAANAETASNSEPPPEQ